MQWTSNQDEEDAEDRTSDYYWVVFCKNRLFHNRQNIAVGHAILLGETDAISPCPPTPDSFAAQCDDCGREYAYRPTDLLRFESETRASFIAHPLFNVVD